MTEPIADGPMKMLVVLNVPPSIHPDIDGVGIGVVMGGPHDGMPVLAFTIRDSAPDAPAISLRMGYEACMTLGITLIGIGASMHKQTADLSIDQ